MSDKMLANLQKADVSLFRQPPQICVPTAHNSQGIPNAFLTYVTSKAIPTTLLKDCLVLAQLPRNPSVIRLPISCKVLLASHWEAAFGSFMMPNAQSPLTHYHVG